MLQLFKVTMSMRKYGYKRPVFFLNNTFLLQLGFIYFLIL
ncbi:hypothetical protein F3D3_0643 [Fusibacter sp. 3D3]|nr:hypothetical protein F3D3_0643 [Fusibacter sp. 3D3]